MQDDPTPAETLEVVAIFLREEILPKLEGLAAFQLRVAANAIDLVRRQVTQPPTEEAGEHRRLTDLLGHNGSLRALTSELATRIREGAIGLDTPGLFHHLWLTTCAKLAVDQPAYAGLQRAILLHEANKNTREV